VEPEIVVFDLVGGVSSAHSDRSFDADTSYEIYIRVDSDSPALNTAGPTGEGVTGTWGAWSGAANLGADDRLILVGDSGPVLYAEKKSIDQVIFDDEDPLITWKAGLDVAAQFFDSSIARQVSSTPADMTESFSKTKLFNSAYTNFDTAAPFSQVYKTTMPLGILTSQALFLSPD